jgi:hypothetical protein
VQIERCPLPPLLRPLLRVELFDVTDEPTAVQRLLAAVRAPRCPDGVPVFPGRGTAGALTSRGETGPRLPGTLPRVWNVGPRNHDFVGRDAALAAVRERLQSAAAAVVQALHGLGGVGKTQLAIEYAYRYADSYDLVWWVNAEQSSLIGDQYAALAGELGLVGPHADTASAVSAVYAYLRGHSRWLLVLDTPLSRRRRVLGEDHVECELTALNLARDLRALGEVEAAQQLQADTVAYRRRWFGDDHPLTINATNELGATLRALGQVEAARRLHEDMVARGRRVLGEDNPGP